MKGRILRGNGRLIGSRPAVSKKKKEVQELEWSDRRPLDKLSSLYHPGSLDPAELRRIKKIKGEARSITFAFSLPDLIPKSQLDRGSRVRSTQSWFSGDPTGGNNREARVGTLLRAPAAGRSIHLTFSECI